jgi:hypothetical protein
VVEVLKEEVSAEFRLLAEEVVRVEVVEEKEKDSLHPLLLLRVVCFP